jgi:hypothetical protein
MVQVIGFPHRLGPSRRTPREAPVPEAVTIVSRPLAALVLALPVFGCAGSFPMFHATDPDAAAAVSGSAALSETCRQRFVAALAGKPANFDNGPSIERDGAFTRITLEAQSPDPDTFHPYRFECRFEGTNLNEAVLLP